MAILHFLICLWKPFKNISCSMLVLAFKALRISFFLFIIYKSITFIGVFCFIV
jgi:hypothetical protein